MSVQPSVEELAISQALLEKIILKMKDNDNYLSFYDYMQISLYEPGLGYYVNGQQKFGEQGDFITAPERSALFSQTLANQTADILKDLSADAKILELGAGSGIMAADMMLRLQEIDQLPSEYWILEVSGELQARQYKTIKTKAPDLINRVTWLSSWPEHPIEGVIWANEVLDAMPASCFEYRDNNWFERGVTWDGEQLTFVSKPASQALIDDVTPLWSDLWPQRYQSEYNPQLNAWISSLSACLSKGVAFFIDYGYPQQEYYHPQRDSGTLRGYYHHQVLNDTLRYPGLIDITSSVDFTAVANASNSTDLEVCGYATQAFFLLGNKLEQLVNQLESLDTVSRLKLAQQIKFLTLPSEMGEKFQVIGLSKSFHSELAGFSMQDLRYRL